MKNGAPTSHFGKKALALAVASAFVAASGLTSLAAQAQTQEQTAADIETVTVTARKKVETIQDIPGVVNVLSRKQLRANGTGDAESLALNTPGVVYSETYAGASSPRITIRGVGDDDFNPNGSASAAIHVNGVYQGTNGLLNGQYFDIDRVEVLKGPQGTLYGRNATAGAVNILSKRPGIEFGGYLDLDIGNYGTYRGEGAVDLPVSETFLVRVAGMYESSDGFYEHLGTGPATGFSYAPGVIAPQQEVAAQGDWGGADRQSARITAEWEASADTLVSARLTLGKDDSELAIPDVSADNWAEYAKSKAFFLNPQDPALIEFAKALDNDPFTVYSNMLPKLDSDQQALNLQVDHDFESGMTGTLLVGYEALDRQYETSDNLPFSVADYGFENDFSQFTVEARLAGDLAENIGWLVGAFMLKDDIDFGTNLRFLNSGLWQTDVRTDYQQERDSFGLFASSDWTPVDWFTLETGIRYSSDEVTFKGQTKNLDPYGVYGKPPKFFPAGEVYIGVPIAPNAPLLFDESLDDSEFTWKVSSIFTPAKQWRLYATVSTGYKAGGFDGSTILTPQEALPIDSETLVAYELGAKYRSDNGLLSAEVNLFNYDFEDYQSTAKLMVAGASTNVRANVADATIKGAELAFTLSPLEGLEIRGGGAFISSEIDNFQGEDATIEGNDLPFSPDLSWNLAVVYATPISEQFTLRTQLDASNTGEHYQTIDNNDLVDGYTVTNARIALEAEDWEVALWVRNLADKDYNVGFFPTTGLTPDTFLKGAPRTFGVNFMMNF
ncbi:TonB-dependent receptor [Bowmanella sp. Y26]|uniref:TonB-dependent receptor n=1 Tax=Bowmanella yangjiangensis TaxID=2811230 RepID=UPI001BDC9BC1|nr:TonB-dependent receptor [Bowmanella yangjiangensis]MBT1064505.1 TonB-dependent receptor [Bowmanella yangjiangensis]